MTQEINKELLEALNGTVESLNVYMIHYKSSLGAAHMDRALKAISNAQDASKDRGGV